MSEALQQLFVGPDDTIRDVMACVDRSGKGIALLVDTERRLLGTITDGDIRRAILAGVDLNGSATRLLAQRNAALYPKPVTALAGTPAEELLRRMTSRQVRQIPLVDANGRVADLVLLSELVKDVEPPMRAIVMAGGYGKRLQRLTKEMPKPMLPVGDRPLLERLIEQLREVGITRVNLVTHYKADVIAKHFGDGSNFGVTIQYVEEDQPLGTAGGLSRVEVSHEPLLIVNGDILTSVDFRAMLHFHREHAGDMTVAVQAQDLQVPYGVIETDGVLVTGVTEKPVVRCWINAGIYLLNPEMCRYVPANESFDMPDLIRRLMAEGKRVVSFPIREYWKDIGHPEAYEQAKGDVRAGHV